MANVAKKGRTLELKLSKPYLIEGKLYKTGATLLVEEYVETKSNPSTVDDVTYDDYYDKKTARKRADKRAVDELDEDINVGEDPEANDISGAEVGQEALKEAYISARRAYRITEKKVEAAEKELEEAEEDMEDAETEEEKKEARKAHRKAAKKVEEAEEELDEAEEDLDKTEKELKEAAEESEDLEEAEGDDEEDTTKDEREAARKKAAKDGKPFPGAAPAFKKGNKDGKKTARRPLRKTYRRYFDTDDMGDGQEQINDGRANGLGAGSTDMLEDFDGVFDDYPENYLPGDDELEQQYGVELDDEPIMETGRYPARRPLRRPLRRSRR